MAVTQIHHIQDHSFAHCTDLVSILSVWPKNTRHRAHDLNRPYDMTRIKGNNYRDAVVDTNTKQTPKTMEPAIRRPSPTVEKHVAK